MNLQSRFVNQVAILICLSVSVCTQGNSKAGDITVADIVDAWENRDKTIPTFECECKITKEITRFLHERSGGAFDDPNKGEPGGTMQISKGLTVKLRGKDIFILEKGEHCDIDNFEIFDQSVHIASSDGRIEYFVTSSRSQLAMGGFANVKVPGFPLPSAMTSESSIIQLWYDPLEFFAVHNVDIRKARRVNENPGTSIDLVVTLQNGRAASVVVSVSSRPPYLPLEYKTLVKNSLLSNYELEYQTSKSGDEILSSWAIQQFRGDGSITSESRGKVQSFQQGKQIEDKEFELSYPIGAHLIEYLNRGQRKYWVQESFEEKQEIEKHNFGRKQVPELF
ncbi:hypothetical protein [Bythopirellula goksoeyrii]|uniref:Uncharacterized protein n=1 Tax=Bythopirellula goksoeyrii TaxID=1400387 RepID=A0A5B9Q9K4_9BACT|nr:hypothetical protein [Bythopirellula goksoeyrii]QEG34320.1 hypothetical protein Pr1d_15950 [Bythopirellula goksoeyrii]